MKRIAIPIVSVCILMSSLAGCQNPEMRRRWSRREERFDRTTALLGGLEDHRRENLERTTGMLRRQHERDLENSARNPEEVRRFFRKHADRWRESQPRYREVISELLEGDWESMRQTYPLILQ